MNEFQLNVDIPDQEKSKINYLYGSKMTLAHEIVEIIWGTPKYVRILGILTEPPCLISEDQVCLFVCLGK